MTTSADEIRALANWPRDHDEDTVALLSAADVIDKITAERDALLDALQYVMVAHGEQLTDAFEQANAAIAKALPCP